MAQPFSGDLWFSTAPGARWGLAEAYAATLIPNPDNPWRAGSTLRYSFNAPVTATSETHQKGPLVNTPFTAQEREETRATLALISRAINLTFIEDDANAQVIFGHQNVRVGGYSSRKDGKMFVVVSDDVVVRSIGSSDHRWDGIGVQVLLHEIAHGLGLEHPRTYRPEDNTNPPYLPVALDTGLATVMSYNDAWIGFSGPQTYMLLDIAALKGLYGSSKLETNDRYVFTLDNNGLRASNGSFFLNALAPNSLFDPGGNNTLDYSALPGPYGVAIDLSAGSAFVLRPSNSTGQFRELDFLPNGSYTGTANKVFIDAANIANGIYPLLIAPGSKFSNIIGGAGSDIFIGSSQPEQFDLGAGDDQVTGGGGADIVDGRAGFDTAIFSGAFANYKINLEAGGRITVTDLRAGAPDGADMLINVEYLKFADFSIRVDSLSGTPIAAANAAKAMLGETVSQIRAELQQKYAAGAISYSDYLNGLLQEAQQVTFPALIVSDAVRGSAPTQSHLNALIQFAKTQLDSYLGMGVARPDLGPYEALGRGHAVTDAFKQNYGALSQAEFDHKAYRDVFERDPTASQAAHFDRQIDYFQSLYTSAGIAPSEASLLARGAVFGQMLGFATRDEANFHRYDDAALKFIQAAIAGASPYGQPLDFV